MLIPLSAAAQKIIASMPVIGRRLCFQRRRLAPARWFRRAQESLRQGLRRQRTRRCTTCDGQPARCYLRAGISADMLNVSGPRLGRRARHLRQVRISDEKPHAFEALAALIERIVHPPSGDVVVPMPAKGARK